MNARKLIGAVALVMIVFVSVAFAGYWQDRADEAKADMDAAKLGADFARQGLDDNSSTLCTTWSDIYSDEYSGDVRYTSGEGAELAGNAHYALGEFAGAWGKYLHANVDYVAAINHYENANDHANQCDGSGGCGLEGHGGP